MHGIEQHDGQDGNRINPLAQRARNDRRDNQDPDDQISELGKQFVPSGQGRRFCQAIGTVALAQLADRSPYQVRQAEFIGPASNLSRVACRPAHLGASFFLLTQACRAVAHRGGT